MKVPLILTGCHSVREDYGDLEKLFRKTVCPLTHWPRRLNPSIQFSLLRISLLLCATVIVSDVSDSVTHLQHLIAAVGKGVQVGQMFHHLRCHYGMKPLYFLLSEVFQGAGLIANSLPQFGIVGAVQLCSPHTVLHWVNSQDICS